jgi:hypothetical protein
MAGRHSTPSPGLVSHPLAVRARSKPAAPIGHPDRRGSRNPRNRGREGRLALRLVPRQWVARLGQIGSQEFGRRSVGRLAAPDRPLVAIAKAGRTLGGSRLVGW